MSGKNALRPALFSGKCASSRSSRRKPAALVGKAVGEVLADALEKRNTFLLVGHSYDKNLADMISGTLAVKHTTAAVEIEAALPDPDKMPSWVRDAVLAVEAGPASRDLSGLPGTGEGL